VIYIRILTGYYPDNAAMLTSPKRKSAPSGKCRSKCWDFFTKVEKDGRALVRCTLCEPEEREFVFDGSTGNMLYHLRTTHAREYFKIEEIPESTKQNSSNDKLSQVTLDQLVSFSGEKRGH